MATPHWLHALMALLMEAWSARRDAQIRFLKAQVEMLQARLPGNRIIVAPEERLRLLRLGVEVGHQVDGKPPPLLPLEGNIRCRQFLGGLLKHYYRSVA